MAQLKIDLQALQAGLEAQAAPKANKDEAFADLFVLAALRPVFSLDELFDALKKLGKSYEETELDDLLAQSKAIASDPKLRYISDDFRRQILTEMGSLSLMKLFLPDNARQSENPAQRTLARYIYGEIDDPRQLGDLKSLTAAVQVAGWLAAYTSDGIPKVSELQALLRHKELIAPFERITAHFQGRRQELERLHQFVWQPVDDAVAGDRYAQTALYPFSMLVWGIGGAGKTTLIARFILEQLKKQAQTGFAFAYIDFDRPNHVLEPLRLLDEMARQMQLQYPEDADLLERMRQSWKSAANSGVESTRGLERDYYLNPFGQWWRSRSGMPNRRLLMVLDSFEEIQNRADESERENLLRFLVDLSSQLRIRVVISGRAQVGYYQLQELSLGDFDPEAALGFLKAKNVEANCAASIIRHVGGNPLDLTLAAAIAEKAGCDNPDQLFKGIDEARHSGILFTRLLDHIHDPKVKQLAMPGLVVRLISAEIIRGVLAEPCGLAFESDAEAENLMQKLQEEAFLVEYDQGIWRFRPDLRCKVIDLPAQTNTEQTHAVHDKAVEFYALHKDQDPRAKAEWIYHRLKRGDQPATLNLSPADFEQTEPYLVNLIHETPPELALDSIVFLAGGFGIPLENETLRQIQELDAWERSVASSVVNSMVTAEEDFLRRMYETTVSARSERSVNSTLRLPEALLCERIGMIDRSRTLAEAALHDGKKYFDVEKQLAALFRLAGLSDRGDDHQKALQFAATAYELALKSEKNLLACKALLLESRAEARIKALDYEVLDRRLDELIELDFSGVKTSEARVELAELLPETFFRQTTGAIRKGAVPARSAGDDDTQFSIRRFCQTVTDRLTPVWLDAQTWNAQKLIIQQLAPDNAALETLTRTRLNRPLRDAARPGVWEISVHDLLLYAEKEGQNYPLINVATSEKETNVEEAQSEESPAFGGGSQVEPQAPAASSEPVRNIGGANINPDDPWQNASGNIDPKTFQPQSNIQNPTSSIQNSTSIKVSEMLREMQGSGTSGASADQIKNLIAQGRTEEAVKILLSITENTASKDEALLLSGRLNALTRQNRLGMIDFREYQADLNRITYAALKLVDEMAKHTEIRVATSDITDVEIVGGRDRVEHMAGDGNLLKIKWLENSVKTAEAIGWVKNNNTGGVVGNFSVVNFEGNDYLLTDARFADMTLGYVFENNIVEYSGQYLAKNVLKYQTMELSGKSARFLINRNQSGVEIPLTIAHEAIRSQRDAMLITVTAKGPAIHFVEISDNGGDVIRILSEKIDAILPGAPLLDREWRLIGMMQTNTSAVSSRTFFRELAQNNAEAASVERPQMGAMKFVVFYEEKDEHYAQTLKKYLKPISLSKGLKLHLLHSDALGGEDPLRRAMSELDSAQYVICMITADFLAGEWAPFALEKTGKRVIPIRCTQMSLEGTGYDKLRSLPTQGRTVADFPSEDAAFADIAAELRRLLA